jgi:hypothetical protein
VPEDKKKKVKKQLEFDEEGDGSDSPLVRKRSKSAPTPVMQVTNQAELDFVKKELADTKAELLQVRKEKDILQQSLAPLQEKLGNAIGELKGLKDGLGLRKGFEDR